MSQPAPQPPAASAKRNTATVVLSVLLALTLIGTAVTTTLWLSVSRQHEQVAAQLATRDGDLAEAKKTADEAKKAAEEAKARPVDGSNLSRCQEALRQMLGGGVEDSVLKSACGI